MRWWRAIRNQAQHPKCEPTPFTRSEIIVRALAFIGAITIGAVVYPTLWWLLVAFVLGVAVVMHPLCFVLGRRHAPGGHWFHFR